MNIKKPITIEEVIYIGKRKNKTIDKNMIIKAYKYAKEKHKNQFRKSGELYIVHPLNVAYILANLGLDTETICAALLHDIVEDTDATYNDIKKNFGQGIAEIVEGVTKLSTLFKTVDEMQAENYKKMFIAMEKDIRVIILKLADRLHNINTLEYLKKDRQIAISKETIEVYAPIANKLGMHELKTKLEDGAFKFLYPEEYRILSQRLNTKISEKQEFLKKTKYMIENELRKQRMTVIIKIETKHLYNIYKKMKEKQITIDEIKDLFSMKIITKQKQECYMILGIINTLYSIMPGTFKDYIATPRNNMYQAIHEIILGEKGVELEIQVCTYMMNKISKYGITNYFSYIKKGHIMNEIELQKNLYGIHDSLELIEDPKEFLKTLKSEVLDDEIYIFTPKGDITVLPKESTAIDFAYSIHDEIGNHMIGCKINSIDMPLVTKLKNGNIVEIIISQAKTNPEEVWIDLVKTAKAKTKLLKLLKEKTGEEKKDIAIHIIADDRRNLVLEITDVYKKNNQNIKSLTTKLENGQAQISIILEVYKNRNINELVDKIKNIESVKYVGLDET